MERLSNLMAEQSLSWNALNAVQTRDGFRGVNAEYNLLYILGLLLTFTSLFFIQSEL
jgi:hypothetical protein